MGPFILYLLIQLASSHEEPKMVINTQEYYTQKSCQEASKELLGNIQQQWPNYTVKAVCVSKAEHVE